MNIHGFEFFSPSLYFSARLSLRILVTGQTEPSSKNLKVIGGLAIQAEVHAAWLGRPA